VLVEPEPGTAENGAKTFSHNTKLKCRHCNFIFSASSATRVRARIISEAGKRGAGPPPGGAAIRCPKRSSLNLAILRRGPKRQISTAVPSAMGLKLGEAFNPRPPQKYCQGREERTRGDTTVHLNSFRAKAYVFNLGRHHFDPCHKVASPHLSGSSQRLEPLRRVSEKRVCFLDCRGRPTATRRGYARSLSV
jgi:hypothetical protein